MDIIFNCTSCNQELAVDAEGAGSEIQCPTCDTTLIIPAATPQNVAPVSPNGGTAARVEKHFAVPQRSAPESLIKKPKPTLEVAAKETDKKIRIKTIKHGDCVEVGKSKFDEIVTEFLQKIGQDNIIAMHPISYSHTDAAGKTMYNDFGIMIIFKG
ncbi:MAG: hypothetical protein ACK4UN_11160 [Limisphaerales bacterium]